MRIARPEPIDPPAGAPIAISPATANRTGRRFDARATSDATTA
jgi:hypothetical protein